jgi:GTPase SAR1 family protein
MTRSLVATQEETVCSNREHLQRALKKGTKKWGRSKIMIVGDGRAGKTALANSIMGEEFVHTESTIGINQMTCDVKFAEVGKEGQWDEYTKPDKELEAALAKIVAARRSKEDSDSDEEEDAAQSRLGKRKSSKEENDSAAPGPSAEPHSNGAQTRVAGVAIRVRTGDNEEVDAGARMGGVMAVDDALVMKYLANLNDNTKFVISLFDYGGQSVFNVIHHLFLTRYGVYTLVFNMEQLVSPDIAVRENCLSTISFWLNSIVVHTWHAESESMAPIVIVGTHKDIVKSAGDHAQISKILRDKFCSSVAWPFIQKNVESHDNDELEVDEDTTLDLTTEADLCFFPVDNRRSRKDTTVQKMMKLIEDVIDRSEYVHAERPLTWLQTMDRLTACGKAFLPLSEVEAIAGECDVPRAAVPSLLSFLHEMGILMWHDDITLRDVVILDAVAYFVKPVTTIICKHLATAADATRHVVEAHKKCSKLHYDAWMKMVHQGIASSEVIDVLLEDCSEQAKVVEHLMVKFGLIVPLGSQAGTNEYLVPALLPVLAVGSEELSLSDDVAHTCLFVFTCSAELKDRNLVTFEDTEALGFLPRGLFERLICKAVEWCRVTSAVQSLQSQPLFQDAAVLAFGNQRFRMRAFHAQNCIQVDFARGNPLAVHQRLSEQLQQIMDECMKSLRFFTVLPLPALGSVEAVHPTFVPLDALRGVVGGTLVDLHVNDNVSLSRAQLTEHYGDWLVDDALRGEYDVFISYRWGTLDSRFTERLCDRFSTYNVGEDSRAVTVFLDNKRLRDGRRFVDDFARALVHSLIVVPVVSADAILHIGQSCSPAVVNETLVQWIMALECLHSPLSRVKSVVPVLFGRRHENSDTVGDLFEEKVFTALPEEVPTDSIVHAQRLLRDHGVEPRACVDSYTVRSIVAEVLALGGFCAWTATAPSAVVPECAEFLAHQLIALDADRI